MKINALIVVLSIFCFGLSAQNTDAAFKKAKSEIEATFGHFPSFFEALPESTVPGLWAYFQAHNTPNAVIPAKYRELIQLAVAAQIPCDYCIFFHTEAAKAYGASEEEVAGAILSGAHTRNWSMMLQGNQIDLEAFKKDMNVMVNAIPKSAGDGLMKYNEAVLENNPLPAKYVQLTQLAVASQIPCDYCIYFHTEAAKSAGATGEEIKEAIFDGASTRNWSMILQGNQIELEDFKEEFQRMMAHMAEQAGKK